MILDEQLPRIYYNQISMERNTGQENKKNNQSETRSEEGKQKDDNVLENIWTQGGRFKLRMLAVFKHLQIVTHGLIWFSYIFFHINKVDMKIIYNFMTTRKFVFW